MPMPEHMQKGSHGPHVALFQAFLKGFMCQSARDLLVDGEYGDVTAIVVSKCQRFFVIEVHGDCGPQMLAAMKEQAGFDFLAAAMAIPGITFFVQRDGSTTRWSPEMEAPTREGFTAFLARTDPEGYSL